MEQTEALKKQVGGNHYNKKVIQPWHIIDDHSLDFYEGNAVKYILRDKGDRIEDVEKAIHYLERKLELLKKEAEHEVTPSLFDEETQLEIDEGRLAPQAPTDGQKSLDGEYEYRHGRWQRL